MAVPPSGGSGGIEGEPRVIRSTAELFPKRGLFDREQSEFELRDQEVLGVWPYPIPAFEVEDLKPRYQMGLHPLEGPLYKTPAWLNVMLCPMAAMPERTPVLSMERRGVIQFHYDRMRGDRISWGYRLSKGWKHPEFVSGSQLSKTVRVFQSNTLGPDRRVLHLTYMDNPQHRSRKEALDLVDQALRPFRDPELPGFPLRPAHDPRIAQT